MKKYNQFYSALSLIFCLCIGDKIFANSNMELTKVNLGEKLFFDKDLSFNKNQSCATCHNPDHAYTDNRKTQANGIASQGSDGHSFGDRNTPTAAYAKFSPKFHFNKKTQEYIGGQFLDGRAIDLAEQAGGPPVNPVEMAMENEEEVINRIKAKPIYYNNFIKIYGKDVWSSTSKAYTALEDAIATYEKTEIFAPFDSKYDRYLRGEYELTLLEDLGRTLFFSNNNLKCIECHSLERREDLENEAFTNYEYHNIGVPSNPEMIKLHNFTNDFKDEGLAKNPVISSTEKIAQRGKFKVPTLRNVAITAPYMHNGVFKDLRTVILFYDKYNNPENKINPETGKEWNKPEIEENLSMDKLLAKKLNDRKVDALVAFLETLTDKRYEPLLEKIKQEKKRNKAIEK